MERRLSCVQVEDFGGWQGGDLISFDFRFGEGEIPVIFPLETFRGFTSETKRYTEI